MSMDFGIFEELGLTEAEAKVYVALLGFGSSTAGPIIKKTGLHRGTTYAILERLAEKGLVSHVMKGSNRFFSATAPERFLEILHEREERFREILPELKQKAGALLAKQEVNIFTGVKGIKSVCEAMLNELSPDGEYLDFGVSGLFKDVVGPYFRVWQQKKEKFGIKSRCIFDESVRENKELLSHYVGEAKFIPIKYYSSVDTFIYNDKVFLGVWKAEPPYAILIKSREVADSYRSQFNLLWESKTITLEGREGYAEACNDILRAGKDFIGISGKGGTRDIYKRLYPEEYEAFHRKRIERKLCSRVIVSAEKFDPREYMQPCSKFRKIAAQYASPGTIWVYGNNVSLWLTSKPPAITIIRSKELAESYRKHFEILWKLSGSSQKNLKKN